MRNSHDHHNLTDDLIADRERKPVRDPLPYLQRGNFLQRRLHKVNTRLTGSSINLVSNGLKISFDGLLAAIEGGLARSRAASGQSQASQRSES
jgi:hypothetical protein